MHTYNIYYLYILHIYIICIYFFLSNGLHLKIIIRRVETPSKRYQVESDLKTLRTINSWGYFGQCNLFEFPFQISFQKNVKHTFESFIAS